MSKLQIYLACGLFTSSFDLVQNFDNGNRINPLFFMPLQIAFWPLYWIITVFTKTMDFIGFYWER